MAEVIKNDKNFLIIKLNEKEANKLNIGIFENVDNNILGCGSCKITGNNPRYYIAAINEILCEDCMNDFVKNMSHYTDKNSLKYEVKHFNHCANLLDIDAIAGVTVNGKLIVTPKSSIADSIE